MSGHNKWSSIKHKKAAVDAKKGKAFSRVSKEIMLAVRLGGKDPSANSRLRLALSAAREANMPMDNVERAIKKASGEGGAAAMEEMTYEGFAPGGVAVMVDCLSDNKNRTGAEVRTLFNHNNGKLEGSGSVGRLFHRKARVVVTGGNANEDKLMEICLNADVNVEDISVHEDRAEITGPPEALVPILEALEKVKITPSESGLVRVPMTQAQVSDIGIARQVLRLLDKLEDHDDVKSVYSNAEIPDDVLVKLGEEA